MSSLHSFKLVSFLQLLLLDFVTTYEEEQQATLTPE